MRGLVGLFLYAHAVRRMHQRGISRSEIYEALRSPETTYPSANDPSRIVVLGTTAFGRRLKIVVERDDPTAVVTVAVRDEE